MRAVVARIAAAVIAALATFVAGNLGVEVTEDTRAALTEAVTVLGLAFWGITYAVLHKVMNRFINPTDAAGPLPYVPGELPSVPISKRP